MDHGRRDPVGHAGLRPDGARVPGPVSRQTLARLGRLQRDRGADSLACPICGVTAMVVTDSRPHGGRIWRRRMCRNRHRFSTTEAVDADRRSGRHDILLDVLDGLSPADLALVRALAARLARSP